MLKTTQQAILAILRADPSIYADEFNRIKGALEGNGNKTETPKDRPLIKRAEVSRLTGLSGISIDRYARMGFLRRVYLGNSSRASGFDPASVDEFLQRRNEIAEASRAD
jgi:predicted DNA-binding transcriptional regulator AlpA